jgi:uncharacterized protein (DUF952 family)
MIYHLTALHAWREAQERGEYRAASMESEGFIHCSTQAQVLPVANNFYQGQPGLLMLKIDPSLLSSELRWEPPSGGSPPPGVAEGDPFPHVYGPINLDAIVKVYELESNPDGSYKTPAFG